MNIVGMHGYHDASVCLLRDGHLALCIEAEKDSHARFASFSDKRAQDVLENINCVPDAIAVGGWYGSISHRSGYEGIEAGDWTTIVRDGIEIVRYSCSHERTHIWCSYALSPFEQNRPCYAVCWEGTIGALYSIGGDLSLQRLANPMREPGHKYAFLFELADSSFPLDSRGFSADVAGKLMALASFSNTSDPTHAQQALITAILDSGEQYRYKRDFCASPYFNIGVETPEFCQVAAHFSDALFDRFYRAAKEVCVEKRPLLIAGGCGLNCDWNSRWLDSGLFDGVFVPPCVNDSGSAIGAAVDAQFQLTGNAKLSWSVYCGENLIMDSVSWPGFVRSPLDYACMATALSRGLIVGWANGRCEMGPRALGNRSIIAAPFSDRTKDRLNTIKKRAQYRPVAPMCREEDIDAIFEPCRPSPHMLYFHKVKCSTLGAVTHVDNSARLQSISEADNLKMYLLLSEFKKLTGTGVLCNTSLNYPGRGFINRASDLFRFAHATELDAVVIEDQMYFREVT